MRLKRATMRRQVVAFSSGIPLEYTPGSVIEWLTMVVPRNTTSSQIVRWPPMATSPAIWQRLPIVVLPEIPVKAAMAVWAPT